MQCKISWLLQNAQTVQTRQDSVSVSVSSSVSSCVKRERKEEKTCPIGVVGVRVYT